LRFLPHVAMKPLSRRGGIGVDKTRFNVNVVPATVSSEKC
jgi:hypothetical protein